MIKLEPNEKIIAFVRKHWFVMFSEGIILFFMAILPPIMTLIGNSYFNLGMTTEAFFLGLSLYGMWLLFIWILFFLSWTDHYLDAWVITNKKIINIDQRGIFNRKMTTMQLNRIQDVSIKVEGILATFLDIGDLVVQTAGQNVKIVFKSAAKPYQKKEIISTTKINNSEQGK